MTSLDKNDDLTAIPADIHDKMTLLATIAGTAKSASVSDLKKLSRQINLLSLKSIQTKPL